MFSFAFTQQKGMKLRSIFSLASIVFASLVITSEAYGLSGEGIVLDPNTGNYQITYFGTDLSGKKDGKVQRQAIYVPATKIQPAVISSLKLDGANVVYSYLLKNASSSQQSLASFAVAPVSDIISKTPLKNSAQGRDLEAIEKQDEVISEALKTPQSWTGLVWSHNAGGLQIMWRYYFANKGLKAGSSQDGFGFSSKDIPGIGIAQFRGRTPVLMFVDGGPTGKIKNQLKDLRRNNFVSRAVAVPAIAVPKTFNAAVLLERIRSHVSTWSGMKLLDPAFAAQLDRHMAAASRAFKRNQPQTGRENIDSLRKLLEHEHGNLDRDAGNAGDKSATSIDRLAARVLDFDLQYVLERMK